jgi:hypothetical protein
MPPGAFDPIFFRLCQILRNHSGNLTIKDETPIRFSLVGGQHPKHKTPMPIAWVEIGKNYVSYHLMPIYGCPKLPDKMSAELRARMQGKSCFNFKVPNEALFAELDQLTTAGLAALKKAGYLS